MAAPETASPPAKTPGFEVAPVPPHDMSTPVPTLTCDFSWEDEQGAGFFLPWSFPWMEGAGLLQGLAKACCPSGQEPGSK